MSNAMGAAFVRARAKEGAAFRAGVRLRHIASTVGLGLLGLFAAACLGPVPFDVDVRPAARPETVFEFNGELRDGVLSIEPVWGRSGGVREAALSVVQEDRNGDPGTAISADRFEFVVETPGASFEGEPLGSVADGCGPGVNSNNFAVTARSFLPHGLASAYVQLTNITVDGVTAPQHALCNSDDPSPNVFADGSSVPVDASFGLIRYGNLRPDADGESIDPVNMNPGADPTAATMVWKFPAGGIKFVGRVIATRCAADLCLPGNLTGVGVNVPSTQPNLWEPLGDVNAVAAGEGVVYVGGAFSVVSPRTGGSAMFDLAKAEGADRPLRPFANLETNASAIVPDTHGGYYVAGSTMQIRVNGLSNVVHVLANGALDLAFPDIRVDIGINALAYDAATDTLYLGGPFSLVGAVPRNRGAAVNGTTGALLPFDPNLNNEVRAILLVGPRVFFAGKFTTATGGADARLRVAAWNTATGALDPMVWDHPTTNGIVHALATDGVDLFTAGAFTAPRARLASFDLTTGVLSTTFPEMTSSGDLRALALRPGPVPLLFVGNGTFGGINFTIGGAIRQGVAAIDLTTRQVIGFNGKIGSSSQVLALATSGDHLAVGGTFVTAAGTPQNRLALYDISDPSITSLETTFDAPVNEPVTALVIDANARLYVAAGSRYIGGVRRKNLVALDISTGEPLADFAPAITGSVSALAVDATGTVIAGGAMTVPRANVAAFASNGALTAFAPVVDGPVNAIVIDDSSVWLGGAFGSPTANLARVAASDGAPVPGFTSSLDGAVHALALRNGDLYAGGAFTAPGTRFVRLGTDGALRNDYNADGTVFAIATNTESVFATGDFTSVLEDPSAVRLVGINRRTNTVGWTGSLTGGVAAGRAIAVAGNHVYVGGGFLSVGSTGVFFLSGFSARDGLRSVGHDRFAPVGGVEVNMGLRAIAVVGGVVIVGGRLTSGFEAAGALQTNGASNSLRVHRSRLAAMHAN